MKHKKKQKKENNKSLEKLQEMAKSQTGINYENAQNLIADLQRLIKQKGEVGRKAQEELDRLIGNR